MSSHPIDRWQHSHNFLPDQSLAERGTRWVMVLTAIMMVVEIAAGIASGSMALLADGWHMATHVAAFGIAVFAYRYARAHAADRRFTFGTGKAGDLGGFASAVTLAIIALLMASESVMRLVEPRAIALDEALWIACIGLGVNLLSAVILNRHGHEHTHAHHDRHDHDDHHHDDHHHDHGDAAHRDHNLHAAYMHVIADALTSVLAIIALLAGKFAGALWLDPVMGLVGSAVILRWAYGLARDASAVLLDAADQSGLERRIRQSLEQQADEAVSDLHVWSVAPGRAAAALSIVTHDPRSPEEYRARLAGITELVHIVIEINHCREDHRR